MKNQIDWKPDRDPEQVIQIVFLVIILGLVIGLSIFRIYVFNTYGDRPITEVPAWVFWVMQDGGRK